MLVKDLTDNINELASIYGRYVNELRVETFKEYYKNVYGEDEFYSENNLLDMYEMITDPYTLWEAEPETLKEEIQKVLNLIESDKTNGNK
jgi:hypothetical protein